MDHVVVAWRETTNIKAYLINMCKLASFSLEVHSTQPSKTEKLSTVNEIG